MSATKGSVASSGGLILSRSSRESGKAQRRAHRPRINEIDAQRRLRDFLGIAFHQRFERGFAGGVRRPEGSVSARGDASREDRAAGRRGAQQRIERADQPPIRGEIHVHDFLHECRLKMPGRREMAERRGAGNENIDAAEALMQRRRHRIELIELPEIERTRKVALRPFARSSSSSFSSAAVSRDRRTSCAPSAAKRLAIAAPRSARGAGDESQPIFEVYYPFPRRGRRLPAGRGQRCHFRVLASGQRRRPGRVLH